MLDHRISSHRWITITGTARFARKSESARPDGENDWPELALADTRVGCSAEVIYQRRYPPLVTHAEPTAISIAAASALVGANNVETNCPPFTGSEDFSFMLQARPGGFIMIGNGAAKDGSVHHVHTPGYDFNDDILTLGGASWIQLVRTGLGSAA